MYSAHEGLRGDAEQIEGLALNVGELRRKGLERLGVAQQRVPLGQAEEACLG
jgi:hypothetical protein